MSFKFKIETDHFKNLVNVYGMSTESGQRAYFQPVTMAVSNNESIPVEPMFSFQHDLGQDFLQGLVNELYNAGYYPQQDSQKGELSQTHKHLDDMKQSYKDVVAITNKLIDKQS